MRRMDVPNVCVDLYELDVPNVCVDLCGFFFHQLHERCWALAVASATRAGIVYLGPMPAERIWGNRQAERDASPRWSQQYMHALYPSKVEEEAGYRRFRGGATFYISSEFGTRFRNDGFAVRSRRRQPGNSRWRLSDLSRRIAGD